MVKSISCFEVMREVNVSHSASRTRNYVLIGSAIILIINSVSIFRPYSSDLNDDSTHVDTEIDYKEVHTLSEMASGTFKEFKKGV